MEQVQTLLAEAPLEAPVWRVLVDGLLGLSPQLAREIVFRALGDTQVKVQQTPEVDAVVGGGHRHGRPASVRRMAALPGA